MRAADLAGLACVARLASDLAEARLAAVRVQENALRARLRAMDEMRAARAEEAALDPARMAGQDLVWERWSEDRRRALNAELARVLARGEAARDALRLAFGRRLAAEALERDARAEAVARRQKREERGW